MFIRHRQLYKTQQLQLSVHHYMIQPACLQQMHVCLLFIYVPVFSYTNLPLGSFCYTDLCTTPILKRQLYILTYIYSPFTSFHPINQGERKNGSTYIYYLYSTSLIHVFIIQHGGHTGVSKPSKRSPFARYYSKGH